MRMQYEFQICFKLIQRANGEGNNNLLWSAYISNFELNSCKKNLNFIYSNNKFHIFNMSLIYRSLENT